MVILLFLLVLPLAADITNVRVLGTSQVQAIIAYTAPDATACTMQVADANIPLRIRTTSGNGATLTVTTRMAHGLVAAGTVYLTGTGVSPWDGWQTIATVSSSTVFTITHTTVGSGSSGIVAMLVNDVNTAHFTGSNLDSRIGNLTAGRDRTFIVGQRVGALNAASKRVSRALQNASLHYFRITCGADTASGSFMTENPPLGKSSNDWQRSVTDTPGEFHWPSLDHSGRDALLGNVNTDRVIDPFFGTMYRRMVGPRDMGKFTETEVFSAATDRLVQVDGGVQWTSIGNIAVDDAAYASFTGTGSNWLYLGQAAIAIRNNGLGDKGWYYTDDNSIDWVQLRIKALGLGGTADARTIQVCLSIDGGANCATTINDIVLDSTESQKIFPASPTATFAEWTPTGSRPLNRAEIIPRVGSVDTNGTAVTWVFSFSTQDFNVKWQNGSKIKINAVEYTIASVQSLRRLTLTTTAGTQTGVAYSAPNFGIMIRKKSSSTDEIRIQHVDYILSTSMVAGGHSTGAAKLFGEKSIADGNGDLGYLAMVPMADWGGIYWVSKETGESRFITTMNVDSVSEAWSAGICQTTEASFSATDASKHYCVRPNAAGTATYLLEVRFYWDGTGAYGPQAGVDSVAAFPRCTTTSPASPNPCRTVTNLTGAFTLVNLINAFEPLFITADFTGCGIRAIQTHYAYFMCGRSTQDTITWLVMVDLDKLIANYNPADQTTNIVVGAIKGWDASGHCRWCITHSGAGIIGGSIVKFNTKYGRKNGTDTVTFTVNTGTNVVTASSGTYTNDTRIRVTTTGTLPASTPQIVAYTDYWIISAAGATFKLATTQGGGEIAFTGTGTGTHYITNDASGEGPWRMEKNTGGLNNSTDVFTCSAAIQNTYGYQSCSTITVLSEPYDPNPGVGETGATGYLFNAQVGDYLDLSTVQDSGNERARIVEKSGLTLTVARNLLNAMPPGTMNNHSAPVFLWLQCQSAMKTNVYLTDVDAYWDFLAAPRGSTTAINADIFGLPHGSATTNGHVGPGGICCERYTVRHPLTIANIGTTNYKLTKQNPSFANRNGIYYLNTVESYTANHQTDLPENQAQWFIDNKPFQGIPNDPENSLTPLDSGTTFIYKYDTQVNLNRLNPYHKFLGTSAHNGNVPLLNISAPSSVLNDNSADHNKFCIAYKAGECRAGSKVNDIYVNTKFASTTNKASPSCNGGNENDYDICITNTEGHRDGLVQYGFLRSDDATGSTVRKLGYTYNRRRLQAFFPKILPHGQWYTAHQKWLDLTRSDYLLAKLPPMPSESTLTRGTFVPVIANLTAPAGVDNAIIEFGYNTSFHCTERAEVCVAATTAITGDDSPGYYDSSFASSLSATTPIRVTYGSAHKATSDTRYYVQSGTGRYWDIAIINSTQFDLVGSTSEQEASGSGKNVRTDKEYSPFLFASSDNCTVTGATNPGLIEITCSLKHRLSTGARVFVSGVGGNTAANGLWIITATGPGTFSLNGSSGNAAYTSGGTVVPGGAACATSCSIAIPGRSQEVLYYRWIFRNGATVVATSATHVQVVP